MSTCFGCGKELDGYYYISYQHLWGDDREFCKGRGAPKKSCFVKALVRMHEERVCPACGESEVDGSSSLCRACGTLLAFAREHRGKQVATQREVRRAELINLVFTIANHRKHGEPWDTNNSWPFRSLVPSANVGYFYGNYRKRFIADDVVKRALRSLWQSMAKYERSIGVMEGANLLAQLKSGNLAVNDFESNLEDQESIRERAERDMREQVETAVDAAIELLEKMEEPDGEV